MSKENKFIARDENNNEQLYEMLMVKNVDDKPIIWYKDGSVDEDNNENIFISSFEKKDGTFVLNPITDDEMEKYSKIFIDEYNK